MSSDLHWHVAVAKQQGQEWSAGDDLAAEGFEVHVPAIYEKPGWRGQRRVAKCVCDRSLPELRAREDSLTLLVRKRLFLSPYFFVQFVTAREDHHALVVAQRGVSHVLLGRTGGRPSQIPDSVVHIHRAREFGEQNDVTKKRERGDHGLALNMAYRVVRGPIAGHVGVLLAVDRGIAFLDIEGKTWKLSVMDIVPAPAEGRRVA